MTLDFILALYCCVLVAVFVFPCLPERWFHAVKQPTDTFKARDVVDLKQHQTELQDFHKEADQFDFHKIQEKMGKYQSVKDVEPLQELDEEDPHEY